MKKLTFLGYGLVVLLIIFSCSDWTVLGPTDGELTVELLNVEVTFNYEDSLLIIMNKNFMGAHVIVSRRDEDVWSDYLELIDRHVPGCSEITKKSYFGSGDKIKTWISILDDHNQEVTRETYFELR